MHDVDASTVQEWAHNWKMSFNLDRNKQAQEVIFSKKLRKGFHPSLFFNDQPIK